MAANSALIRTSLVLPRILDKNFQTLCAKHSMSRTQMIKILVEKELKLAGFKQPNKEPKNVSLRITY